MYQRSDRLLQKDGILKQLRELEGIESVYVLIMTWIHNVLEMWIFPILKIRRDLLLWFHKGPRTINIGKVTQVK